MGKISLRASWLLCIFAVQSDTGVLTVEEISFPGGSLP
jgi:hypothetical protein